MIKANYKNFPVVLIALLSLGVPVSGTIPLLIPQGPVKTEKEKDESEKKSIVVKTTADSSSSTTIVLSDGKAQQVKISTQQRDSELEAAEGPEKPKADGPAETPAPEDKSKPAKDDPPEKSTTTVTTTEGANVTIQGETVNLTIDSKPTAPTKDKKSEPRLLLTNGIQFSSNRNDPDEDNIFSDASYFAQFYYPFENRSILCADVGFGVEFSQTFVEENGSNPTLSESNPDLETVTKADSFALLINSTWNIAGGASESDMTSGKANKKKSRPAANQGLFTRLDLGGRYIIEDSDSGIDQRFDWEPKALLGFGHVGENRDMFNFLAGVGYYERIDYQTRSVFQLSYVTPFEYAKDKTAAIQIAAEFNGLFKNRQEEVFIKIGITLYPTEIFNSIGNAF